MSYSQIFLTWYSFNQRQFLDDETQGNDLTCAILINRKLYKSENYYHKTSLKVIEDTVQNIGKILELGNPHLNENVYKITEYKYFN